MAKTKVLVLGDDTRSFLAIVRSLGRRGLVVHAAPANFTSVALRSRYIEKTHDLPALSGSGAAWVSSLE
jgi:ActR/RegA family two-component response regulator